MLWVRGKNFVVTCTRALMGVARCIYGNCFVVNIPWFASQPRKPRKFYPPKNTRYTVYIIITNANVQCMHACSIRT